MVVPVHSIFSVRHSLATTSLAKSSQQWDWKIDTFISQDLVPRRPLFGRVKGRFV